MFFIHALNHHFDVQSLNKNTRLWFRLSFESVVDIGEGDGIVCACVCMWRQIILSDIKSASGEGFKAT